MPYPHPIRLRGAWEWVPLERHAGGAWPAARRVDLPVDWSALLGDDFRGRIRLRRFFNCPTTLDPPERLWLVIESLPEGVTVMLDDQPLVASIAPPWQVDLTSRLQARHELTIDFTIENAAPLPLGPVRLEVRLRGLV